MVTDEEIAGYVESLLRAAPPGAATTVAGIVHQLELKLGLDLSHKAPFIHDQINLLLSPPKDHFALHHHRQHQQQFHLPQFQIPHPAASAAPPTSSSFLHFPRQHELAFRHQASAALLPPNQFQFQYMMPSSQMVPAQAEASPPSLVPNPRTTVFPTASASAPRESVPKRKGGPGGLSKVCGVSPELQAIVGKPTMARTQIVKELWAYIRKNNLQDPNNRRKIICNDELRLVFETDYTDMFKMNKLLAKHIIPLEETKEPGSGSKKLKTEATEDVASETKHVAEHPILISAALAKFFAMPEKEMLQSEALQRVWNYIKANQLEDPTTMSISCDCKLQELFGCESFTSLSVSELMANHLLKKSRPDEIN